MAGANPMLPTGTLQTNPNRAGLVRGARLALAGLAANVGLAGIKIFAGVVGHSYALIADGIESCLDVFGSLIVLSGLKLATTPPDANHPYGHGKAEPLAAAVVAFALIAAAFGLAALSIRGISSPGRTPSLFTLPVLILVIVTKESLYRTILRSSRETGSRVLEADAWHHRSDALTTAAAVVGVGIALIGGPGYESADKWAALFACAIIGFNGVRLLRPAIAEIMDTAPNPGITSRVRRAAMDVDGVIEIDKCRVRKMGLDYYVDIHIRVHGTITVLAGHRIAHRVKDSIRREIPEVADVLVHTEPEVDETGRSIGLDAGRERPE